MVMQGFNFDAKIEKIEVLESTDQYAI